MAADQAGSRMTASGLRAPEPPGAAAAAASLQLAVVSGGAAARAAYPGGGPCLRAPPPPPKPTTSSAFLRQRAGYSGRPCRCCARQGGPGHGGQWCGAGRGQEARMS